MPPFSVRDAANLVLSAAAGAGTRETKYPRDAPQMTTSACGPLTSLRAFAALCMLLAAAAAPAQSSFVNFESGHVRPLALSPAGDLLFAVNTPDNRLTIYTVTATGSGLTLAAEVPVGLEPVAGATRTKPSGHTEAWVANHLSDSVSVVE